MALVDLYLNNKHYQVACDNGQEAHVKMLAEQFDARLRELAGKLGPAPEPTLLALAALMAEDELHTVRQQPTTAAKAPKAAASAPPAESQERIQAMEKSVAKTIDDIAARLERIADTLEKQ